MEWEFKSEGINKDRNVYECYHKEFSDMVIAETADHARIKFKEMSTLMGKPIITKEDIRVKLLYELKK